MRLADSKNLIFQKNNHNFVQLLANRNYAKSAKKTALGHTIC